MDAVPSIERLSQQAVSAIRSGISVPTVAQAVEELVANAIDASAKTISIRLDIKKYWLSVDDDGSGIKDADLPLVGQRYHTSKCQQLEDLTSKVTSYGFRGEVSPSCFSSPANASWNVSNDRDVNPCQPFRIHHA